jgi:hypothetical protein
MQHFQSILSKALLMNDLLFKKRKSSISNMSLNGAACPPLAGPNRCKKVGFIKIINQLQPKLVFLIKSPLAALKHCKTLL